MPTIYQQTLAECNAECKRLRMLLQFVESELRASFDDHQAYHDHMLLLAKNIRRELDDTST